MLKELEQILRADSVGRLPTTEKNTFRSEATASNVFFRARAATNAR